MSTTSAPGAAGPRVSPSGERGERLTAREIGRRFLTLREGSIIVVTLIAIAYFSIRTNNFFSHANFVTLLPYFAPFAILAAGEVFLMVNGEIDLSIGSVYLFAPFMYYEFHQAGLGLLLCLILALVCCAAVGVINGIFTELFGINSFIVTLAMLLGLGGLTLIISHAQPVAMPGAQVTTTTVNVTHVVNGVRVSLPEQVNHVGGFARFFGAGTYSELLWALGIVIALQLVLTRTRWGLYSVAVGGNRLGAREAGINVRYVVIRNFILCSVLAGFVGVMEAMRSSSVTPDTAGASEVLFRAISAAVIGGTLLAGGQGTVIGAFIGALFLGVLRDGLTLQGINADYLDFILGIAILVAMTINVYVGRVRQGSGNG